MLPSSSQMPTVMQHVEYLPKGHHGGSPPVPESRLQSVGTGGAWGHRPPERGGDAPSTQHLPQNWKRAAPSPGAGERVEEGVTRPRTRISAEVLAGHFLDTEGQPSTPCPMWLMAYRGCPPREGKC